MPIYIKSVRLRDSNAGFVVDADTRNQSQCDIACMDEMA